MRRSLYLGGVKFPTPTYSFYERNSQEMIDDSVGPTLKI